MTNPVLEELVLKLRDPATNRRDFRDYLERIGLLMGYDISLMLDTEPKQVTTMLGVPAQHTICKTSPIVIAVLRAGLPFALGISKAYSDSELGFIAAERDEETLIPKTGYLGMPDIASQEVILADTMLATGGSVLACLDILERYSPKRIIVAGVIGSEPGISRISAERPDCIIRCASVDPLLDDKGYIVPGLGDAGDRAYGRKMRTC